MIDDRESCRETTAEKCSKMVCDHEAESEIECRITLPGEFLGEEVVRLSDKGTSTWCTTQCDIRK